MKVTREDPVIVVELAADRPLTDAELDRAIADLDTAIEQPRFGLLVHAGASDRTPKTPGAVRRRWRAWLASRGDRFEQSCAGVAMITASSIRAAAFRLASPLVGRMFHAPSSAFADEPAARAWLADRLRTAEQKEHAKS